MRLDAADLPPPASWSDVDRAPLGVPDHVWESLSWAQRRAVTRRCRPPAPSATDPGWRLAALDARRWLDRAAPNGRGTVVHRRAQSPPTAGATTAA